MKRDNPESDEKTQLAGSLLLAHPSLRDGNFRRSVILLPMHDENGSMGIVLNHPLRKRLGQVDSEFEYGPLADVPVYRGGPVAADTLLICAWKFHPEGLGLQMMFGVPPQKAIELQADQGMELRAFFGYAGWTAGQLKDELKRDTWIVTPLMPHLLDGQHDERMWKDILGDMGDQWRLLVDEPDDPSLN